MQDLRVAVVSSRSEFADTQTNMANILAWIDKAADERADLVCFPEVAVQGYAADEQTVHELAEPIDGPSCRAIIDVAHRRGLIVSVGMALRQGDAVYNSNVLLGSGGAIGISHKMHLTGTDLIFTPGDDWPVFDLGPCKVGAVICRDSQFVESARVLALRGAEVVIMPFAGGRLTFCPRSAGPGKRLARQTDEWRQGVMKWMPARACDNGVFVIVVNHAGNVTDPRGVAEKRCAHSDGTHRWPGCSFIVSPDGTILAESDRTHNDERMLVADLEAQQLEIRDAGLLEDRRPATYSILTDCKPS